MECTLMPRGAQWTKVADKLYQLQRTIRLLKQEEECLKEKLKYLSRNESSCGGRYMFTLQMNKGKVNYRAIPELQAIDLDKYRNEAYESWKLEKIEMI